jgi:hypothetical protein
MPATTMSASPIVLIFSTPWSSASLAQCANTRSGSATTSDAESRRREADNVVCRFLGVRLATDAQELAVRDDVDGGLIALPCGGDGDSRDYEESAA